MRSRSVPALGGLVVSFTLALVLASGETVARHAFLVGAVEDAAKWGRPLQSMELARRAGLRVIVLSSVWSAPLLAPDTPEVERLRAAAAAAVRTGIEPIIAVYWFARETPRTSATRGEFVSYAATSRARSLICAGSASATSRTRMSSGHPSSAVEVRTRPPRPTTGCFLRPRAG